MPPRPLKCSTRRQPGRGPLAGDHRDPLGPGVVDQDRHLAAEAERPRVGDAQGQDRGGGRVGRVAASLQDFQPGRDRVAAPRGHGPLRSRRPASPCESAIAVAIRAPAASWAGARLTTRIDQNPKARIMNRRIMALTPLPTALLVLGGPGRPRRGPIMSRARSPAARSTSTTCSPLSGWATRDRRDAPCTTNTDASSPPTLSATAGSSGKSRFLSRAIFRAAVVLPKPQIETEHLPKSAIEFAFVLEALAGLARADPAVGQAARIGRGRFVDPAEVFEYIASLDHAVAQSTSRVRDLGSSELNRSRSVIEVRSGSIASLGRPVSVSRQPTP